MRIGVSISTSELPPAVTNTFNTGHAFMVGLGDDGAANTPYRCLSTNDVSNAIGVRTATNATLWDSADIYFREGGSVVYLSRVVGPTPVNATLTLQDVTPHPTVVVTAKNPGALGNTLKVANAVNGGNYTVTIQDSSGNVLETHGPYATSSGNAPLLADKSSTLVNFTQSAGSGFTTVAPAALSATALTTGTDDRTDATLTSWTTAINSFDQLLGPGQISAPGQTNSALSGIWSALGTHASVNNRIAICDMRDGQTAAQIVTDLGSFGTSAVASYCGFWAGQCVISGVTPGTTRTVPASAVISALCAQADLAGNPNTAAAGLSFPLGSNSGVSGFTTPYVQADIDTLNAAGVNTFNTVFGVLQNYGFVSAVLSTSDDVYWQLNHGRLRMALVADFRRIGQPFVFSQIDGKGLDIRAFSGRLAARLQARARVGAIYTTAPDGSHDQGFVIDTGSSVNTPTSIQAGILAANVSVRMSPFAQLVTLQLIAIPVNQTL